MRADLALLIGVVLTALIVGGGLVAELAGDATVRPQTAQTDTGRYLSPQEAATAICQGATDIGEPSESQGCGRLDICGALNSAATITNNPVYTCETATPVLSVGGVAVMPDIR